MNLIKKTTLVGLVVLALLMGTTCSINADQASKQLSQKVNPATLTITTAAIPDCQVGVPCSYQLTAGGGVPPYTWSIATDSLPVGLTLSSDGKISGTPTTYGTSNFTVQVKDSQP